jgi:hypothetical protein
VLDHFDHASNQPRYLGSCLVPSITTCFTQKKGKIFRVRVAQLGKCVIPPALRFKLWKFQIRGEDDVGSRAAVTEDLGGRV